MNQKDLARPTPQPAAHGPTKNPAPTEGAPRPTDYKVNGHLADLQKAAAEANAERPGAGLTVTQDDNKGKP